MIHLPSEEKKILLEYIKKSPLFLVRLKSQAVILKSKGLTNLDIAESLGKGERTVRRWTREYKKYRLSSIFTGHKDNENAAKLTREQKKEVELILQTPVTGKKGERALPPRFWDVPKLKTHIKAKFGVVYESKQSYHFILKFSNLSFKYPDKFDTRRDDEYIEKRMLEIKAELKPYFKDPNCLILTSDECRVVNEALTRRAWLPKGKKTILKVTRKREHQNYIGFLNQKTYKCRLHRIDWQNQDEILKVFKHILKTPEYRYKKIIVLWDNARFHKGAKIHQALRKGNLLQQVHLINLPPYAPDKNPIERVWRVAKDKIANFQEEDFNKTKIRFENYIRRNTFKYSVLPKS